MPRKFIRRWLPSPSTVIEHKALRWMGPILHDPNLFHLNRDSVSKAFLVGMFCAFLPLPGHMIIVTLAALLVRGNLPISLALVWISNPLTIPPLTVASYWIGQWVLGATPVAIKFKFTWEWFLDQGQHILPPVVIGSVLSGIVLSTVSYWAVRVLWRWKITSDWRQRKLRREARR